MTRKEMLPLLAAAPKRLAVLTRSLSPAQLRTPEAPDEWSANDVLAHLRACADIWNGAIARIIAEDHPTLRAINPRAWIKETDYLDVEFGPSLRAFAKQRADLLACLEPLPPAGWLSAATVTGAGRPLEKTVLHYAERQVRHERPHLKQIERMVATLRAEDL